MNTKNIISPLDKLLKPLGFNRKKTTWNRELDTFVDVIDVQVDKLKSAITVNAGVFNKYVHHKCWGEVTPAFIEEPLCTVRTRIGQLVEGKDLWWSLEEESDISEKINIYIFPFFEQMHNSTAMEQFLNDSRVIKQKYPPPIIYLAILRHQRGDHVGACSLLSDLKIKTIGAWKDRIDQVIRILGENLDPR